MEVKGIKEKIVKFFMPFKFLWYMITGMTVAVVGVFLYAELLQFFDEHSLDNLAFTIFKIIYIRALS